MTEIKCWQYNHREPIDLEQLQTKSHSISLTGKRSILKTGIKSNFDHIEDSILEDYFDGKIVYLFVDGCGPNFVISSLSKNDKIIYLSKTNTTLITPTIFFSFQTDYNKASETIEKIINATLQFLTEKHNKSFSDLQIRKARDDGDGAVNINNSLLKKIKQSALFIGDITLIGKYSRDDQKEKYYINTNVCVETGYALSTKQPEHIILACMCDVSGKEPIYNINSKSIPFDLSPIHIVFGKDKEEFCKKLIREMIQQLFHIYKIDDISIDKYRDEIYSKLSKANS
jgi:hypothetical protein